jgi:hypothetical protein
VWSGEIDHLIREIGRVTGQRRLREEPLFGLMCVQMFDYKQTDEGLAELLDRLRTLWAEVEPRQLEP